MILCFELNSDDRSEYASIQAILYGPYLLAGHTTGDWELELVQVLPLQIGLLQFQPATIANYFLFPKTLQAQLLF